MDTGPTYGLVTETVGATDTAGDLLGRLAESGARLLAATLDGIADGSLTAVPQPAEGVSLAPKVTTADARADFTTPAAALDRLIRSVTPEPGAWCWFRGDRLGIGPVRPLRTGEVELAPGELRVERRRVLAGTATVPVELGEVKPKGKRSMPAPDWARGARIDGVEYLS